MLDQLPKHDAVLVGPGVQGFRAAGLRQERRRARSSPSARGRWACARTSAARPPLKKEIGAASDMGADWPGGYYCPCHNSRFDLAGRVFKGSPAPKNLDVPPHRYAERHAGGDRRRHRRGPDDGRHSNKPPVTGAGPLQRRPHLGRPALPAGARCGRSSRRVLRAEELQLLVLLRLAGAAGAGDPDRLGHLPHDELQARRGAAPSRSVEYIMRDVPGGWLIRYMHSTGASVFFIVRLPAHGPRADVRLVPQAARADLDLRRADLPRADGRGVLRLPAAVGPDVVLGRAGDHQPVRHHPVHRRGARDLDPRRLQRLATRR